MTAAIPVGTNPFSTRFVRPGALPYRFADPVQLDELVRWLQVRGWRGQIVGPHGSGKSTLLHTLAPQIRQTGRSLVWLTLRGGQRRLTAAQWSELYRLREPAAPPMPAIIIDGFQQLSWATGWRLRWLAARHQAGLLITTHRPLAAAIGLRVATQLDCPLPMVQQLVSQLMADYPDARITPEDVTCCYEASGGNVRETFFALYDLFERRRWEG